MFNQMNVMFCNVEAKLKPKKFTGLSNKSFAFWLIDDDSVSRKKLEPVFTEIFNEMK